MFIKVLMNNLSIINLVSAAAKYLLNDLKCKDQNSETVGFYLLQIRNDL